MNKKWVLLTTVRLFIFLFVAAFYLSAGLYSSGQSRLSKELLEGLIKNFEYTLEDGSKYRLQNGYLEQGESIEDFVSVRLDSFNFGDLNSDNQTDAAVILVANYGGSGSFYNLTVLLNNGTDLIQTNSLELGDRIKIESLKISSGKILVTLLTHRPDDPLCCPSRRVNLEFRLKNGLLQKVR